VVTWRRHPSKLELEAWFDGEPSGDSLGWHISGCARCLRYAESLAKVRVVVTGALRSAHAPADAATDAPAHGARRGHRQLLATTAAVVGVGALVGLGEGPIGAALFANASDGAHRPAASAAGPGAAGTTSTTAVGARVAGAGASTSAGASGSPGASGGGNGSTPGTAGAGASADPLRLAVIVPTMGAAAVEGAQVADAVRQAVDEANAAGGVRGLPVRLTVVPAEDPTAVASLAGTVDAVVGGFGASAPAGVPWYLPADPSLRPALSLAAELDPQTAGARLASDLVRRGLQGPVGVIDAGGSDGALGAGIAQVLPVDDLSVAAGQGCLAAVQALTRPGSSDVALAVAGPPSLAAACVTALTTVPKADQPPGGLLLAPDAAYAGVGGSSSLTTVLGLPWPTSASPGAARFRAAVPGVDSYRALVSFAATELAIDVARTTGAVTMAAEASSTWRSDLVDFDGPSNLGEQAVTDGPGGWNPEP